MTATHNAGPMISFGYVPGSGGSNPEAGPSADYQASSILDARYPYQPGSTRIGHVKAFLNYAYACLVDAAPQVLTVNAIISQALGAVVPAGGSLAIALQSTNSGLIRAVNVPLVPYGQQLSVGNRKSVLTIDPAHTKVTTANGSKTVTIPAGSDARLVTPGQYIAIPGGAGTGICLVARVISKNLNADGSGTMLLDTAASAVVTNGPLMLMDLNGVSVVPWVYAGAVAEFDPHAAIARVLTYASSSASDTGYSVTTVGYDHALNPMSETVALTAGGSVNGRKAFKHILSATLNKTGGGTTVGTVQVGTSDTFGFNMKSESWEYVNLFFAGAFVSASTGWVAADGTTANTTTTGDTRGLYTVQAASDGTKRLAIFTSIPMRQALATSWDDPTPLFGVPQA